VPHDRVAKHRRASRPKIVHSYRLCTRGIYPSPGSCDRAEGGRSMTSKSIAPCPSHETDTPPTLVNAWPTFRRDTPVMQCAIVPTNSPDLVPRARHESPAGSQPPHALPSASGINRRASSVATTRARLAQPSHRLRRSTAPACRVRPPTPYTAIWRSNSRVTMHVRITATESASKAANS
jgi:hypothetical protein